MCSTLGAYHGTAHATPIVLEMQAQSLSDALREFARQTGIQVAVRSELTDGKTAPRLVGSYEPEAALQVLLAGSGLVAYKVNENTYGIQAEGASAVSGDVTSLDAVQVFGTLENELSVGSKSGQSLRETPKSVTIVTRERLEAQNLTSMLEALGQTTGVMMRNFSPVSSFIYSRSFRVQTLQLDGGAPAFTGSYGAFLFPDMAAYEQLQMLRGVDGMYTGAGEPGGIINLVRKRAKGIPEVQLNLSAGSWDARRAEVDVTGPITGDGRLRGRGVVARDDRGYFFDRAESKKTLLFATAEYDITPSTLLIGGLSYERRKEDSYYTDGFGRYIDGSDLGLPRETAFNPPWNHWYFTNREVFARLEQNYGETGVLKLNITRLDQESRNRYMLLNWAVDPATLTGPLAIADAGDNVSVQNLLDLSASGKFQLLGRQHRYTVGADYSEIDNGGQKYYSLEGYDWPGTHPIDVFDFDPSLYPRPNERLSSYYPERKQAQNGLYATVGFRLTDPLTLTLGGRYANFRYLQISHSVNADGTFNPASTTRYQESKFIPSVALTWEFAQDWSAYASFAETFKVQANSLKAPLPGTPLDPITGAGYELGVKGEMFGFLNAAAAIYRINRNGQAVRDPSYPATPGPDGTNCCFLQQANIVSEGLDAEISGTILPGWQMFAGYTYGSNSHEGGNSSTLYSSGVYYLSVMPKHMFRAWTTWQLPGQYSDWTINAGVSAQSDTYVEAASTYAPGSASIPYRTTQSGYAIWNASVQYRLSDHWSVSLYGDNLFDKSYYQVIGSISNANAYGTPRSYVLRLSGRW